MSPTQGRPREDWDVVVIGAGPAGSSTALQVAEAGYRVLVLERRRQVGFPVQCAEYVPLPLLHEVCPPDSAVAWPVESLQTYVEGRLLAENRWPGVILNRALFDRALAERAVNRGARLLTGCRVEGLENDTVFFRKEGELQSARARIIVGADGPLSIVGRSVGLRNRAFVYGLQVEAPLVSPLGHTQAHFRPEFVGGYGWVFPKGTTANVGLGVVRAAARALPRLMAGFVKELREQGVIAEGPLLGRTGGLIPCGGPPVRTVGAIHELPLLLVGDAAGQTDPITGSGIPAACSCGRIAGRAILDALAADEPHRIRDYEEQWRGLLGNGLNRALRHRDTQERDWNTGPFEALIRSTWIAFPEYYRDR
jgi:geranylgeranyl reductase family protein